MNRSLSLPLIALAATSLLAAEPAKEAKPGELSPKELQQLVRDNNGRLNNLKRTLEGVSHWHNDKKPRDTAFVNSNVTEMVKLLHLPVGAADAFNEAEVHRLAARSCAHPLNLRLFDFVKGHYQEALRLAASPAQKARLTVEYADYMDHAAMEGDRAYWDKVRADVYADPALKPSDKLDLLDMGIPGLDFEKEGLAVAGTNGVLRARYYERCLDRISKANGYQNRGGNQLWYGQSDEHKLEVAEAALADAAIPENKKGAFVKRKIEALKGLERFAEAESYLLEQAATTNNQRRAPFLVDLGDFYVERARRCASKPEPSLLEKAVASYESAIALSPRNGGYVSKQISALMQLRRYDDAMAKTDYWVTISRDGQADRQHYKVYADCWYYKGDYAKACEFYDKFDDGDKAMQRRYAESLYVVGRYDDAIAHIRRCYDGGSFRKQNAYFIRKIEEKKAAANP
jgi:tetratricopeptide (TPR) repeat protein